jgi:alanine racemase
MTTTAYSTWLEISQAAIRNNVRQLLDISQTRVMAVVKADGYGHGALAVAEAATAAGAGWCGVARLDEGLQLRRSGINSRILALGYTPPDRVADAVANNITLTVYDRGVARDYANQAAALGEDLRIHLKVDTGMGRLGMRPEEVLNFFNAFHGRPGLVIEGLFTHFARADEPHLDTTDQQMNRFWDLLTTLENSGDQPGGLRPRLVHAANSAAAINYPDSRLDMVRPGIALFGIDPAPMSPLPTGFKPALTWKAKLSSIKNLPARHGISYGHAYFTQSEECIGVVPVGYADGFRRVPGNFVLIGGRRVPVVGNVAMDQTMIRIDSVPDAQIGDEVVLIGRQGEQEINAFQLAQRWGTIAYEVICGLADRLPRLYIDLD